MAYCYNTPKLRVAASECDELRPGRSIAVGQVTPRLRAGQAPAVMRFPTTPLHCADTGRADAHAARESHERARDALLRRGPPVLPRRRASLAPLGVVLCIVVATAIVAPLALHLVGAGR